MSGLEAQRKLPGGGVSKAEYFADGTGVLHSWGKTSSTICQLEGN